MSEDRQMVLISVSDNGIGIEPDDRAKVFSPFFTTKPQGQGTGLGLALTHRIVQRHGGSISFESEPKKGAAFTVELPVHRATGLPLEDGT
jgi:signal transduction histidine kinase